MKNKLTQERLKELLHYNRDTGTFIWKMSIAQSVKIGSIAGSTSKQGYVRIMVEGERYQAHRLAWFYVYGKWPKNEIHHLNKTKNDNRISNLKDVTARENSSDRKIHDTGQIVGTHFYKRTGKYQSYITVNKVRKHLGFYDTREEASETYQKALKQLNERCVDEL